MNSRKPPELSSSFSNNTYKLYAEGDLNVLNSHQLQKQLDDDEITHYHAQPYSDPGLLQMLKPFLQSRSHLNNPIPPHIVFDFRNAKIDTSVATTCLEVQDYVEKKGAELEIIPGPNTRAVFDCLKIHHNFNFREN